MSETAVMPLLATYNVGNKSDLDVERDLLRLVSHDVTILGLNEVGDREAVLHRVAKQTGYLLVRDDSKRSSGHIAALVSPKVRFQGSRLIPISPRTYVGKNTAGARDNGWAEPKYLLVVRFRVNGERWSVGVTHLVPSAMRKGNTRTRALHAVQVAACVLWLRTRRRRIAAVMGDLNAEPKSFLLRAARRVVVVVGTASHHKRAIDLLLVTKRSNLRFVAVALRGFSSDHRPVLFHRKA